MHLTGVALPLLISSQLPLHCHSVRARISGSRRQRSLQLGDFVQQSGGHTLRGSLPPLLPCSRCGLRRPLAAADRFPR